MFELVATFFAAIVKLLWDLNETSCQDAASNKRSWSSSAFDDLSPSYREALQLHAEWTRRTPEQVYAARQANEERQPPTNL